MTSPSRSDELQSLRRVCLRGALLLVPFLVLQFMELFVLPIDFFTFRVWEAALASPYRYPGPFYPNLHVRKAKEYGDHYRESDPSKVKGKPVEWFTDSHGWRNRPEIEKREHYDIVVLGDSNIVGSFLDQKDILTEVLGARGNKIAYSYSYGSDHVSRFFSDQGILRKSPKLLVVESKAGNWSTTQDYLANFRELPDGSLDIADRSRMIASESLPGRNLFVEQTWSRLTKQPLFHWLKASLATDYSVPVGKADKAVSGRSNSSPSGSGPAWHPHNWSVSAGSAAPIPDAPQPALKFRSTSANAYWHTERFVAAQRDGKIVIAFDARNSISPSRHRVWIFEDGSYRSVGEFLAASDWKTFEFPIATNPGSILEFQIDQPDSWQWLSLKDIRVIGGDPPYLASDAPTEVPMSTWTGNGVACAATEGNSEQCRQWPVGGGKGAVQTPTLPAPGEAGILIRFEARTDRLPPAFSAIYLFEGPNYRRVGQFAPSSQWREYSLLLQAAHDVPIKVQIDFPDQVDTLAIRNFRAQAVAKR